jgi:hypothetical protein
MGRLQILEDVYTRHVRSKKHVFVGNLSGGSEDEQNLSFAACENVGFLGNQRLAIAVRYDPRVVYGPADFGLWPTVNSLACLSVSVFNFRKVTLSKRQVKRSRAS